MSVKNSIQRKAGWVGVGLVIVWGIAVAFGPGDRSGLLPIDPIVVETGRSANLGELMAKIADERVVYVGETHTAYHDHLLQLEVLRGMAEQPGELAVGVEWIQAKFQPVVDRFLAGEIDEATFLRDTEYYDRWRFDYRLYRPIIEFARENGIPIVALNASKELTSAIGRVGIEGLTPELRAELPDGYHFDDAAYEAALREMFELHPMGDDRQFDRFYQAQLTWDETMAQNVASYLLADDQRRMLVLAGKGHVSGRSGIPNRVTRRTGLRGTTVATFDPAARLFNKADYMVLVSEQTLPASGIMGVMLDERDGGDVEVVDFGTGSPAQAAGVKKGDYIVAINGKPVRSFIDVKVLMIDQLPGNEIELTISRDRLLGERSTDSYRFALAAATN
jgi:uncharacterized iron-regulated protein